MVVAFNCLLNTVLSRYDIDIEFLSYFGGCSILMLLYLYVSSYVFKFCEYHRMFLHYIVVNTGLNTYDLYVGIPLESDRAAISMYISIACIFLFIILYLYVKNHRRNTQRHS